LRRGLLRLYADAEQKPRAIRTGSGTGPSFRASSSGPASNVRSETGDSAQRMKRKM